MTDRPTSRLRRRGVLISGLLLLVLIAFGCWLAYEAFEAKSSLELARSDAQQAKEALLRGDTDEASPLADSAYRHALAARDATHSLPWNIAAIVPWIGSPLRAGQQMADVAYGLAADILVPSTDVGTAIAPDRLLSDGWVDVIMLRDQEPALRKIADDAARLDAQAEAVSDPGYVSSIRDARSKLQAQTAEIAGLLKNTALAARVAPSMMGADGPRAYFMGFQTNAEARGTGGLLGGFGVLRFDQGTPTVDQLAKNTDFEGAVAAVDLGPEYTQNFGFTNPMTDFRNSNLSSHFPYAAQIWKSMLEQRTGMNVDGVIAIDPVALSYLLGAVGSVTTPDGEQITKDNVVEITESTLYDRFPTDQVARKNYLQDIASEVVKKMTGPVKSPRALLDALGKAVSERRIAVWTSSPADEAILEQTPLAYAIPDDPAPYAGVVFNNLGGNKMDYYLKSDIEYVADGCDGETRMSTVTIKLANTAKDSLPDYVALAPGLDPRIMVEMPRGTMMTSVRLLATQGASLVGAYVGGKETRVITGVERGHPTFDTTVVVPPGQSGEVVFRLSEPTSPGAARVPAQPLVDAIIPKVSVPTCHD